MAPHNDPIAHGCLVSTATKPRPLSCTATAQNGPVRPDVGPLCATRRAERGPAARHRAHRPPTPHHTHLDPQWAPSVRARGPIRPLPCGRCRRRVGTYLPCRGGLRRPTAVRGAGPLPTAPMGPLGAPRADRPAVCARRAVMGTEIDARGASGPVVHGPEVRTFRWCGTPHTYRCGHRRLPHPTGGATRPPGWAGSLRGSSRSPLEAPCHFFAMGVPPGCNPGLKCSECRCSPAPGGS